MILCATRRYSVTKIAYATLDAASGDYLNDGVDDEAEGYAEHHQTRNPARFDGLPCLSSKRAPNETSRSEGKKL